MRSIVSKPTSSFVKRYCWSPCIQRLQSTEAANSISLHSNDSKESLQKDTAICDNRKIKGRYVEVAADITTTVKDDKDLVSVDRRSKFAFYLPNRVKETIKFDGFKMQRLPTQRKMPVVQLPASLTAAMEIILEGSIKTDLEKQARSLFHKIRDRRVPMERHEWDQKMSILYQGIVDKESVDPEHPAVLQEDRHKLLQDREKALKLRILAELGNYKAPLDYTNKSGCKLYMYSRLVSEYASLLKVFSQLSATLPDFSPSTLLDFGSGVGSVTWAMDRVWPRQCNQTVSIDASAEMNLLNERLQRGGTDDGQLKLRRQHTYFRQFLPASATLKHNLVVASHTLFELTDAEVRLRTLDILWKTVSPGGCLVLVEDGNPQACKLMLEARHFLLETETAKIVAPCPHQFACPLLKKEQKYRICTDSIKHYPYGRTDVAVQKTFSYMIFQKPKYEESSPDTNGQPQAVWPRVVQPVIRSSAHSIVRVCNKFGNLQELAVVKSKHGSLCQRLAKASTLGDLFPVELLHPSEHIVPQKKIFDKIMETRRASHHVETCSAADGKHNKTDNLKGNDES